MKKIPTMFVRDAANRSRVLAEVDSRCLWVAENEGVATVKHDGTSCLVRGGVLHKRYDAKGGKTPPPGWEPCEPEPDPITKHWPGWLMVSTHKPEDRWHVEAWAALSAALPDGTYELVGPKVGGNPYGHSWGTGLFNRPLGTHFLIRHGSVVLPEAPRTYEDLREYLRHRPMEGIVFHHHDGRMAKVKSKDLGLPWPVNVEGK